MLELTLNQVTKKYKDTCAVDHVDAVFTHGVYGLLGANGAGKTTLLRLMCDILRPDEGAVMLDQNPIGRLGASYRRLSAPGFRILSGFHRRKIPFVYGGTESGSRFGSKTENRRTAGYGRPGGQ